MTAVAAAVAVAAGGLAATQMASARPAAVTLSISADKSKLKFNKTSLTAKHGKVTIRMANPSSLPHAVSIEGKGLDKKGKTVQKGGTSTVSATIKKGKYTFYCPVDGHRAAGMKGTLTVT
jgi:plastocyanin